MPCGDPLPATGCTWSPMPSGITFAPAPRYAFEYEYDIDGARVRQRFEFATLAEMQTFYVAWFWKKG